MELPRPILHYQRLLRGPWGSWYEEPVFKICAGLTVSSSGTVYVVDSGVDDRVQLFTSSGSYINSFGGPGSDPGQFHGPYGAAFSPIPSRINVADTGNHRIEYYTLTGSFLGAFGSFGSGPGEFYRPYAVAPGPQYNFFVADTFNHGVQYLTSTGSFIDQFGMKGSGAGHFLFPSGISYSFASGYLYVADTQNHRIQYYREE